MTNLRYKTPSFLVEEDAVAPGRTPRAHELCGRSLPLLREGVGWGECEGEFQKSGGLPLKLKLLQLLNREGTIIPDSHFVPEEEEDRVSSLNLPNDNHGGTSAPTLPPEEAGRFLTEWWDIDRSHLTWRPRPPNSAGS